MKTQKRPWTRAEKWFGALTVIVVTTLGVWGWIDSRPTPPRLDLPEGAFVTSFLLSPDQHYLAVGTDVYDGYNAHTGAVVLWDARTLKQQSIFRTSQPIRIFCLSAGAKQIGILNPAQNVFDWRDRASQKLLWSFAVPKPYLTFGRALFLKKRSLIWLSAYPQFRGTRRHFLLSARSGAIIHQWDDDWVHSMAAVSPDETIAARHQVRPALSGELKSSFLVLQNISNGQILRRFKVAPLSSAPLFSPQGRHLFLLTDFDAIAPDIANNVVKCLDSRTGQQIWSFDALHVASDINTYRRYQILTQTGISPSGWAVFSAIAISPDGATLAVMRGVDSTIYLLDARTGQQRRTLALPLGKAEIGSFNLPPNLLFAPDGKHLFARTQDSIFAWDLTAK